MIELGTHRIICGDASNPEDIKLLMSGSPADLIVTDPPYLAHYVPGNRPVKKLKDVLRKGKMIQNDSMSQEEYDVWLKQILTNVKTVISPGAPFYIWNGFKQFGPMGQMLIDLGFHLSNVITWVKPSICISYSDYNFQSEFCIYGWLKCEGAHKWYGSTKESNIWEVDEANACFACLLSLLSRATGEITGGDDPLLVGGERAAQFAYCPDLDVALPPLSLHGGVDLSDAASVEDAADVNSTVTPVAGDLDCCFVKTDGNE